MPKKIKRYVRGEPNRRASRAMREERNRRQVAVILVGGFLLLLGLAGWAISSGKQEWQGWPGSTRSSPFGKAGNTLGEDPEGNSKTGGGANFPAFGEGGQTTLGTYNVPRYDPITETTLIVNFKLSGKTEYNDAASFEDFMEANYPFFRKQVIRAVRDCELGDLTDKPGLGRKMTARVNRTLGRRFLKSVEFDQMEMFEMIGPYTDKWEPGKAE